MSEKLPEDLRKSVRLAFEVIRGARRGKDGKITSHGLRSAAACRTAVADFLAALRSHDHGRIRKAADKVISWL